MKKYRKEQPVIWHNRPVANISCLYPEILTMIFGFLDLKDKGRAAQVCTSWREACYRKSVWRGVEAKIHINNSSFRFEDHLYRSLASRGIKRIQVLGLNKSFREVITGVDKIEKLSLSGCYNLSDVWLVEAFKRPVPSLVELNLSMCKPISDSSLDRIAHNLFNLEILDLGGCSNITNNVLLILSKSLKKLRHLNLRSCHHISDTGIGHLARTTPETSHLTKVTPAIEFLGLQDCQKITDDALRHVSLNMTRLKSINLNFCASVTDFGLKHLSTMTSIREVNFRSCDNITDNGLAHLSEGVMKDLEVLDVSFNKDKIGDAGLIHIAQKLVHLNNLSLTACSGVTDEGLMRMAKALLGLKVLNLGQCNKITDRGLIAIAEHLVNLTDIDLYGCSLITTVGIEKMMQLPNLRMLNLGIWQQQIGKNKI